MSRKKDIFPKVWETFIKQATFIMIVMLLLSGCTMRKASGNKTNLGATALEDNDYAAAQKYFMEALQEDEEPMEAYRGLGIADMGLGQYEDSEKSFVLALEYADPDRQQKNVLDIRLYLAAVQYRLGKYDETIDTCTTILTDVPEGNAEAYYLRGAGNLQEGQQENAKLDFDAAVSMTPDDYNLYLNIYECYRQKDLSGLGGEYLQSALNIQGDSLEDSYNRGRIYYYLGDYASAQKYLITPAEQKFEPAMNLMGKVYLTQGDIAHAEDMYQQIQKISGKTIQSISGLVMCAMAQEQYEEALDLINEGLAFDVPNADKQDLFFNEIVVYEKNQDFEMAKMKAQEYVKMYPTDEAGKKEWTFLATRN